MTTVVIAHYNEDLNWTNQIDRTRFNVQIYSKTNREYNFHEPNRGNEATAYLKYIVDNYDSLPEHNIFLHGHDSAYHQEISNTVLLQSLKLTPAFNYFNINRRDYYIHDFINQYPKEYNLLKQYWTFEGILIPEQMSFYSCAQFYVHRSLILKHPKSLYENMIEWLNTTNMDSELGVGTNFYSARIFEYMWHVIFTGDGKEPEHTYKELFD